MPLNVGETSAERFHRAPAIPRKISEIEADRDIRVRVAGRVEEIAPPGLILNDGARQEVVADPELTQSLKVGDKVRVFCRVLPLESGFELRAELIQDFSALDEELYRKVHG
jgi:hypothetical protein